MYKCISPESARLKLQDGLVMQVLVRGSAAVMNATVGVGLQ